MCIYFYIYIYILLSLKYLPRPLLISNVDYVPRLWHRQLPLQSRTLLCKDQAHPRPLPSPKGPVTFCPLLTDAEAGQRKPWRPSSAPSFAACWGSHWGQGAGAQQPRASGGAGLAAHPAPSQDGRKGRGHTWPHGSPCSSSPGRKPQQRSPRSSGAPSAQKGR